MKSLKQFLLKENESVIKTSDVVKALKDAGENTAEIKKDVDTTKSELSYTNFIKGYATKLLEWVNVFIEAYNHALNDEREELESTLGKENNKKMQDLVLSIRDSGSKLLKILDTNVDESAGISVKNVRNYENLYDKFRLLLEFEEIASKYEDAHFRELKKEYPDILKEREKLAEYMEGVENCKKYFLRLIEAINQYKNNRLK